MSRKLDKEKMLRVWDAEQIKDLMSRRAAYEMNDWRERQLEELWVCREENRKTASFGRNTGYYVGMDSIRRYYVDEHAKKVGDKTGYMIFHPHSSPYVELSEDGQSARGLWYSLGYETRVTPDGGVQNLWINEKTAADFLREGDGWKIWHIFISNDLWHRVGTPIATRPLRPAPQEDPVIVEFGKPDVAMLAHNPLYLWSDNYPAIPKPYNSISLENSYGPAGHPMLGGEEE